MQAKVDAALAAAAERGRKAIHQTHRSRNTCGDLVPAEVVNVMCWTTHDQLISDKTYADADVWMVKTVTQDYVRKV